VADPQNRDWYAAEVVANGWSRNVLVNQVINRVQSLGDSTTLRTGRRRDHWARAE
jgi:hypothetical protein